MEAKQVILRRWSGRLRTAEEEEYLAYFNRTGAVDYGKTPEISASRFSCARWVTGRARSRR